MTYINAMANCDFYTLLLQTFIDHGLSTDDISPLEFGTYEKHRVAELDQVYMYRHSGLLYTL